MKLHLFAALLLVGLCCATGHGAITVGATTSARTENVSILTFSHTVAAGSDRILVVGSGWEDQNVGVAPTITGITFNGVPLTQAASTSATVSNLSNDSSLWYLVNPAAITANVVVTLNATPSGGASIFGSAINLTGAAQAGPLSTATGTNVANSDIVSGTLGSVAANSVVLSYVNDSAAADSFTVTSIPVGVIENFDSSTSLGGVGSSAGLASQIVAAAGSVTHTWDSANASSPGRLALSMAEFAVAPTPAAVPEPASIVIWSVAALGISAVAFRSLVGRKK